MDYRYRITTFKDNRVLNTKEIKTKDEAKEEVSTLQIKAKYGYLPCDKIYLDEITNNGDIAKRECYTLFNMRWGRMIAYLNA